MAARFEYHGGEIAVRGSLHQPAQANGDAVLLTHGAGANCESKLLVGVADALEAAGFLVLRFDLPFRQERPQGPPRFGSAARDREGIRCAIEIMREQSPGRIFVGGHSYGGRQSSMLVAEDPQLAHALLLLSYPLHPPRKPEQLRTAHFSKLARPAFFVHGTRDSFASTGELKSALELIPAPHELMEIDGAGHDLLGSNAGNDLPSRIASSFQSFLAPPQRNSRLQSGEELR